MWCGAWLSKRQMQEGEAGQGSYCTERGSHTCGPFTDSTVEEVESSTGHSFPTSGSPLLPITLHSGASFTSLRDLSGP